MPFSNLSGDPQQDAIAHGIADDLITALWHVGGLFVIASNSSFSYEPSVDICRAARELRVRHVIEGSLQRAGDRLRIDVWLVDAATRGHMWAETFEGSMTDVFALQTKVAGGIADALAIQLTGTERQALTQRETSVPAAYEAFLRGWEHYRRTTPDDYAQAVEYFKEATRLDPAYGRAYAALAMVYLRSSSRNPIGGLGISAPEGRAKAHEYLREAQKHPTALAHQVAGYILLCGCGPEHQGAALAEFKEAIALDPGDSWAYVWMALALTSANRPEDAIAHVDTAMRLDPHPPPIFLYYLGLVQFSLERMKDAAASFESATRLNPDDQYALLMLAATYGNLGREEDAAAAVARYNDLSVKRGDVPVTIESAPRLFLGAFAYHLYSRGLSLAGVPETLTDGEFAAKNRLTADEMHGLFFGHRLHGRTFWTGFEHAATVSEGGTATVSGEWGSVADGTIELDDDQLCYLWSGSARLCGTVFRNPGGTRAKENEFIWYNGGGAMTFSQVE
jgi:TolB-like protein/Flp pilus assembly protein TadD